MSALFQGLPNSLLTNPLTNTRDIVWNTESAVEETSTEKVKYDDFEQACLQFRSIFWKCINSEDTKVLSWSRWPHWLRHELSSPVRSLESWVRAPLEAWMSVCVYSVSVLFWLKVAALRQADPPYKESYRLCIGLRKWKKKVAKFQKAIKP
jgi:hypothetical protein